jgi:acetyl-CoA carboxylase biotin carboxyl carrier protein
MELKFIQELADIMNNSGLNMIEIKEKDTSIRLECNKAMPAENTIVHFASTDTQIIEKTEVKSSEKGEIVSSPMVGVFYAAPSPDSAPFVTAGSKVKSGDVLCIIEAMKLMNEITAEQDGIVTEVCIKNGDVVQFGQPLFYILSGEINE